MPEFTLDTTWLLSTDPSLVWHAVNEPERWQAWWPALDDVTLLEEGDARGVGRRHHMRVKGPLGFGVSVEVEVAEARPVEALEVTMRGDLRGRGRTVLKPCGTGTAMSVSWRVQPGNPFLGAAVPVLSPLLTSRPVVRQAGEGLAARLGGGLIDPDEPPSPPR